MLLASSPNSHSLQARAPSAYTRHLALPAPSEPPRNSSFLLTVPTLRHHPHKPDRTARQRAMQQAQMHTRWPSPHRRPRGHDELTGDGFDQPVSRIPGESSVIARVQCNMDKMNAQVIKFLEAHAMRFFHDWVPGCSDRAGKHKQRGSSRLSGCMGRIVTCLLD
ncbi:hypothetical protein EJB05_53788 [Eragrostis curvula]|uniref:Uncharacterized protein n=1 Tax=Eragrostis curvula TaxID=38414 RepID=A0A5J9SPE5_9POAL|nr:hypothetical protein EJB05_53788 [Eragrostis curvula]